MNILWKKFKLRYSRAYIEKYKSTGCAVYDVV